MIIPVNKRYRIKANKATYICGKSTVTIYHDDVLTRQKNGKWFKHTGLGRFDIEIPENDVEQYLEPAHLKMMSLGMSEIYNK